MFSRQGLIVLAVLWLGCPTANAQQKAERGPSAEALWDKGQQAMREGQPVRAVECYLQSLARAPKLTRNYLSLAAAFLELGDQGRACLHLGEYLRSHPQETVVRSQYAEVLLRLGREYQARGELERCIVAGQEQGEAANRLLIHCHSRLMEIAEAQEDAYAEHLHRGIGLYLLARASANLPEAEQELPSEGLFCKAVGELTLAQERRPEEARPCWYLYAVWSQLAQRKPALRCLREAGAAAPFSYLTPSEQRDLVLAANAMDFPGHGK